jgi:hypothetical protein
MRRIIALCLLLVLFFQACKKDAIGYISETDLTVFNAAPNNAFTDLINYNDIYYCSFREATSHESNDGKIRVVKSTDGKSWTDFDLITMNNYDLRDPHFFINNHKQLCIGTNERDVHDNRKNLIYVLNGNSFEQLSAVKTDNDYWLWGFSTLKDTTYSIGYNIDQECFNSLNSRKSKIMLFKNSNADTINFENAVSQTWITENFKCPCEASVIFTTDNTAIAIARDEHTPGESHIGFSEYPFTNWQWQTFPYFVRGPKLALLPDGRVFLAAGSLVNYDKTYYAILNPKTFSVEKIKAFQSGGDTGYPGVIVEGNTALISYYSSHEGNARVYITRITY